jgi:hypothetical protein
VRLFYLVFILTLLLPGTAFAAGKSGPEAFLAAYPEAGMSIKKDNSGSYIVLGKEELLFEPASGCPAPDPKSAVDQPLCASLAQTYPVGRSGRHPAVGFDPGRTRNETLLGLLFGKTSAEVVQNLTPVYILGKRLPFNSRQGAAAALQRVGQRLEEIVQKNPAVKTYILPTAGTFHWRLIDGTPRLSPHSFGICIDLNTQKAPYWRWHKHSAPAMLEAAATYPQAIVDAFEAEGFIWGGKWFAFDFMHFEYRPELVGKTHTDANTGTVLENR